MNCQKKKKELLSMQTGMEIQRTEADAKNEGLARNQSQSSYCLMKANQQFISTILQLLRE